MQKPAAVELDQYSSAEKIGFAFYSLSGIKPDFESWVEKKESYKDAYPAARIEMMQEHTQRLRNGFYNYHPEYDFIKIDAEAQILASNFYTASQKRGKITDVEITLQNVPDNNFFPYQVGDLWVAIIIKDLEKFTKMSFKPEEYKEFATKLSLNKHGNIRGTYANVSFTLRPKSVDTKAPIMLRGFEMWLMLAEIAQIEIWERWGNGKKYLWEYRAPWYVSKEEKSLMQLYNK